MNLVDFQLPARAANGTITEKGILSSLLEAGDETIIGAKGVTIVGKNGSYFCRYSNGVLKGIKSGTITQNQLGNLVVYASEYADENGEQQKRLVLGVPQGVFSSRVSADDIKKAALANALVSQKVDLSEIKLMDLVS